MKALHENKSSSVHAIKVYDVRKHDKLDQSFLALRARPSRPKHFSGIAVRTHLSASISICFASVEFYTMEFGPLDLALNPSPEGRVTGRAIGANPADLATIRADYVAECRIAEWPVRTG